MKYPSNRSERALKIVPTRNKLFKYVFTYFYRFILNSEINRSSITIIFNTKTVLNRYIQSGFETCCPAGTGINRLITNWRPYGAHGAMNPHIPLDPNHTLDPDYCPHKLKLAGFDVALTDKKGIYMEFWVDDYFCRHPIISSVFRMILRVR